MSKDELSAKVASKPAAESCRTRDIGIEGYVECLLQGPNACRYALPFGYCFLCCSPAVVGRAATAKGRMPSPRVGHPATG